MPYEKLDSTNNSAEYSLVNNEFTIFNSCLFKGKSRSIDGKGWFKLNSNNGHLGITFGKNFFTKWLMKGDY